jgi:hypothetical protein
MTDQVSHQYGPNGQNNISFRNLEEFVGLRQLRTTNLMNWVRVPVERDRYLLHSVQTDSGAYTTYIGEGGSQGHASETKPSKMVAEG